MREKYGRKIANNGTNNFPVRRYNKSNEARKYKLITRNLSPKIGERRFAKAVRTAAR